MPSQNKIPVNISHPELMSWWSTKNVLSADMLVAGSHKKVLWVCSLSHEWESKAYDFFIKNLRCPYCSGHRVFPGFNDLLTTHPHIASEWHPSKNELSVQRVSSGSNKKVWWLGKCGHEWFSTINNRTNHNQGCAVCRGYQVQAGINDLATTHPKTAAQWDYIKNSITPEQITAGSKKKFWWVGSCGHGWEAAVNHKVNGKGCPYCAGMKILVGFNDLATTHPSLAIQWSPKNDKTTQQISLGSEYIAHWKCDKNHEWQAAVYSRTGGNNCPVCSAEQTFSAAEREISNYISGLGLELLLNYRQLIKGELDIYIPEKKVAIEFNGVYWHSEAAGKSKDYHYNKWKACKDKGIQLIQIWEDDFAHNPEIVKRMLATKLGVATERKVFARNTVVKALTQLQSNEFLNEYHVQGAVDGGIRVGLFENRDMDKPVAVMVLKREPGTEGKTLNLLRYATSRSVVGGFTKLLKYVELTYAPESIVTFSDNCVSDGGLYENNGFKNVRELKPDYMYVVKGERVHKFNYRLKRFREDPELMFEEGLSERELAALNKISRIWDAGKTKWEKKR